MKYIKWILKSFVLALFFIFITNVIGMHINIYIPLNVWTILIVGIFRLPGIIMLIIFFLL